LIYIVSSIILALCTALLYSLWLKQRSNALLQAKHKTVIDQQELIKKLLHEKEWMINEIHHRVKNNLQVVISLLNTQTAYLDNQDAIQAIQNSQHRMHAMSLIHQKLYQSENLNTIDISWYIYELVNYLREYFDPEKKINFEIDTEKLELDVAQAVPLGLILNEAISNAIKHAFPGNEKGKVKITLKKMPTETNQLTIADNGIGLPDDFKSENSNSLGMNLMIGLTDQLDGTFDYKNANGLTIIITFIKNNKMGTETGS